MTERETWQWQEPGSAWKGAGRLLILSPWSYDSGKRHISRADCVALNAMAEEIANSLTGEV